VKLIEGVLDFGDADECRIDGVSGIYQISQHIICVEYFANKVVDGKVQRMIVMRCMWDRSSWIASQQLLARMFTEIVAMPAAPHEHEERVH
jgi:hypothetical protein